MHYLHTRVQGGKKPSHSSLLEVNFIATEAQGGEQATITIYQSGQQVAMQLVPLQAGTQSYNIAIPRTEAQVGNDLLQHRVLACANLLAFYPSAGVTIQLCHIVIL